MTVRLWGSLGRQPGDGFGRTARLRLRLGFGFGFGWTLSLRR